MTEPILLEVSGLSKSFDQVKAVSGVSFQIRKGQVVGLIGANGAGKTTTMRMLATLELADSGSILINGINAVDHPNEVRPLIGWMPDYFHPYKNTSVREYLDFFARAYDIPGSRLLFAVDEVLDFTELGELQTRLINKLSKGQTQRLCLARTLVSDPELLILDEPAAGLDPKARRNSKPGASAQGQGKTLLISSHILSELGEMCDSLIFMDGGSIVHDGDKSSLLHHQEETGWPFEVKIAGENTAPLEEWMAIHPGWKVRSVQENGVTATFSSCEPELVARELRQLCADLPVIEFHRSERRLEEAFVDILLNKNKKPDSASGQTVSPSSSAS
ncbi:ABC transporter ATP-binding protein [Akkermansia sp.]|uniref:ABC transporter ATP-binding protein n=1 Tax=Akkermansia sp. TaxID=1872421 RepID=UPI00399112DB